MLTWPCLLVAFPCFRLTAGAIWLTWQQPAPAVATALAGPPFSSRPTGKSSGRPQPCAAGFFPACVHGWRQRTRTSPPLQSIAARMAASGSAGAGLIAQMNCRCWQFSSSLMTADTSPSRTCSNASWNLKCYPAGFVASSCDGTIVPGQRSGQHDSAPTACQHWPASAAATDFTPRFAPPASRISHWSLMADALSP